MSCFSIYHPMGCVWFWLFSSQPCLPTLLALQASYHRSLNLSTPNTNMNSCQQPARIERCTGQGRICLHNLPTLLQPLKPLPQMSISWRKKKKKELYIDQGKLCNYRKLMRYSYRLYDQLRGLNHNHVYHKLMKYEEI